MQRGKRPAAIHGALRIGAGPHCFDRRSARVAEVATRSYLLPMRAVGLKILKNKLSEYVRLAASGEVVLIADRDRIVAELRPPEPGRGATLADAALAEAVREGWVTPPLEGGALPPPGNPVAPLAELLAELRGDRDAR